MAEHISCQEVVELVTDYLERALPADEMTLFEQHLNFCEGCIVYVEQIRATAETVGRVTRGGPAARDQGDAADRVPGVEALVIAYKFLRSDGRSVFTAFGWPLPADGPGAWVEAPVDPCRSGIHACRASQLPHWAGRVLYEVELGGDVVEDGGKLIAPRGRLVRRVGAWDEQRDAYTRMCADRAHELVRGGRRPSSRTGTRSSSRRSPRARRCSASSPRGSPRRSRERRRRTTPSARARRAG